MPLQGGSRSGTEPWCCVLSILDLDDECLGAKKVDGDFKSQAWMGFSLGFILVSSDRTHKLSWSLSSSRTSFNPSYRCWLASHPSSSKAEEHQVQSVIETVALVSYDARFIAQGADK